MTKSRQYAIDQQRTQATKPLQASPTRATKPKSGASPPPAAIQSSQVTFDYFKDDDLPVINPQPVQMVSTPETKNIIKYKGELSSAEKDYRKNFKRLKKLN